MNLPYYLYLLTFLVFPILGFVLSNFTQLEGNGEYLKGPLLFFVLHNALFCIGYSLKGDYPDYIVFSLEYLFFSFATSLFYKSKNITVKILGEIGRAILILGLLQGLVGILLFLVVSQDYEADKIYNFKSSSHQYQTRRYSFGFATLDDTRFTFETYKTYSGLPFEKQVDKTDLFELKSELDFRDGAIGISITGESNTPKLEFRSSNGKKYVKAID